VDEARSALHIDYMRRGEKAVHGSVVAGRRLAPIPMRRVQSSSIAAAGYDRAQEILRIRYVGGPAYDYLAVPPNVFEDFLAAESKGRFVNWQIKPYYRFMPVADGE
jgi:hypothetical protein